MNKVQQTLIAAALTLPALQMGAAHAAPVFSDGLNTLFFNNYENIYRPSAACDAATCFDFDPTNDPAGYQRANPNVPNNVRAGDVFAGIFNVQNIDSANAGGTIWFSGATDQFTGYFAQEVSSVHFAPGDPWDATQNQVDHIALTSPGTDPFGILAAGEMFRFYVDSATVFSSGGAGSTTISTIGRATDGTLWASLGAGAVGAVGAIDGDGYMYSHADLGLTLRNFSGAAFAGVDFMTLGPAFNLGNVQKINDVNENELGGFATPPLSGTCLPSPPPGMPVGPIACNDMVGTSELEANGTSVLLGGTSPWMFASNDPFSVFAVPEPGTVALMGLGLLGLAAGARRRKVA